MSLPEDYKPCRHCGQLTDSGVCSSECARALDMERAERDELAPDDEDDYDGNPEPEAA